ncbi:hypothetical protein BIY24_01305 [Halobacteriovorax marinus]|uniref:PD-(D/E)XK nuclease family protein n=1 Tax=Halobacteriovorax marinus TaxID=97084 RepID=UPI000BC2FB13|nr:PD-(D/E)XK nuclease family protein [Halobacteriovorax marinus]ATH06618.1 hypothetical protein BIY24_01305 [Halobacteriovorax marinus]
MLSVYLYEKSTEIYNLDFIEKSNNKLVIICPHPAAADSLRSKMTDPNAVEVITISKFSNDLLQKVDPDISLRRKADLLGEMATIWKKGLENYPADSFFDSFNLFTELRGYTLDFEMIKEVLPFYDEAIQKSLPVYWMYFEQLGIVDEHKANEILTHHLKLGIEEESEKKYLFWGFNHVNSGQIDLINALGIRNTVYIPFSKEVFKQTRSTDWIRWFEAADLNEEVKDFKAKVVSYTFAKKRLSQKLKSVLSKEDFSQIVLGEKKVSVDSCLEISHGSTQFRAGADLFNAYSKRVMDQIERFIGNGVSVDELVEELEGESKSILSQDIAKKDFRLLKIYKLLLDIIRDYRELSDDNETIKFYDLQVFREILQLNLPRDYFIPINEGEAQSTISGLNDLESLVNEKTIFLLNDSYQGVKKGGSKYQEDIMKFLSSLGPIQRPELEFLIVREKFREIIIDLNPTFCLQEGYVEGDRSWSEFFRGVEFEELNTLEDGELVKKDILEVDEVHFGERISASKVQTFLDCPRKFYYSYMDRKEIEVMNSSDLRPNEIGTLEHEVIEKYFEKIKSWDAQILKETVQEVFLEYTQKNRKSLNSVKEKISLYEISNYSENGIKYILHILDELPGSEVAFEVSLSSEGNVAGKIDCLIKYQDMFAILDFKRSKASVANKSEIEKFSKIQLPFYLNHFGGDVSKVLFWGYVNLSDLDECLILKGGAELAEDFMSKVGFPLSKRKSSLDDTLGWFSEYRDFEEKLVAELREQSSWPAMPQKDDVCTFCSVGNLCNRGSM